MENVSGVAASHTHSVAFCTDGTVWQWGVIPRLRFAQALPVQVTGIADAVAVAAGSEHSLALGGDQGVYAWGRNDVGQLAAAEDVKSSTTPVAVAGLEHVVAVAAGGYHNLALCENGSVWAWGFNTSGQLGDGSTTNRAGPVLVKGPWWPRPPLRPPAENVIAVAAGLRQSMALCSNGTVWVWGDNRYGQLGTGNKENRLTPTMIRGLSGATAIAAGVAHGLALRSDGSVWAWGMNRAGECGDGTGGERLSPVPVQTLVQRGRYENLRQLDQVIAVTAGATASLALRSDGTVWGWGWNEKGALGLDSRKASRVAIPIAGFSALGGN